MNARMALFTPKSFLHFHLTDLFATSEPLFCRVASFGIHAISGEYVVYADYPFLLYLYRSTTYLRHFVLQMDAKLLSRGLKKAQLKRTKLVRQNSDGIQSSLIGCFAFQMEDR